MEATTETKLIKHPRRTQATAVRSTTCTRRCCRPQRHLSGGQLVNDGLDDRLQWSRGGLRHGFPPQQRDRQRSTILSEPGLLDARRAEVVCVSLLDWLIGLRWLRELLAHTVPWAT